MDIKKTNLDGVFTVEPKLFGDDRGWFTESFRADKLRDAGVDVDFVQDNHSYSKSKGVLRGLHFQNFPYAQSKLVRVVRGAILDVAVDIRKNSKTYGKHIAVELSAENKKQLFIPKGFAHGFLTLTDDTEVLYKTDEYYSPKHDRSINYADKKIGIKWGEQNPTLSQKDRDAKPLDQSDVNFDARVLVTGAKGMLGRDIMKMLKQKGIPCVGIDIADADITNEKQTFSCIKKHAPTAIIHCAAYTATDKAEDEREKCFAINVTGTANVAKAATSIGAKLVYISSDYACGGVGTTPMTEEYKPTPTNYYGETKLAGEKMAQEFCKKTFVVRTSWVFGRYGANFVTTMLRLAKEKPELNVVSDQVGSPTYTVDLARLIIDMIFTDSYGVYNASNEGFCSWYEFAKEILKSHSIPIHAVTSDKYPVKGVRPLNSRLNKDKLTANGFTRLAPWQDALKRFLEEI